MDKEVLNNELTLITLSTGERIVYDGVLSYKKDEILSLETEKYYLVSITQDDEGKSVISFIRVDNIPFGAEGLIELNTKHISQKWRIRKDSELYQKFDGIRQEQRAQKIGLPFPEA